MERVQKGLAYFPLVWLAVAGLFVLRAYFELGFWPSNGSPDPKNIGMDWHFSLVWVGMISLPFVIWASMALAFYKEWRVLSYVVGALVVAMAVGAIPDSPWTVRGGVVLTLVGLAGLIALIKGHRRRDLTPMVVSISITLISVMAGARFVYWFLD